MEYNFRNMQKAGRQNLMLEAGTFVYLRQAQVPATSLSSASITQSLTIFLEVFCLSSHPFLTVVCFLTTLFTRLFSSASRYYSTAFHLSPRLFTTATYIPTKRFYHTAYNLRSLLFPPRHLLFPNRINSEMAGPDYGALGATFKIVRLLQVISLLGCIGMAANFISEMVNENDTPSEELVGTLSIVRITCSSCAQN